MKKAVICIAGFLILSLGLTGCDKLGFGKTQPPAANQNKIVLKGPLVAEVNGLPITLNELNSSIAEYNYNVRNKPEAKITTRDQKISHLRRELVVQALLYQEGLNKGLDKKDDVIESLEILKKRLVVAQLMREEAEKVKPTTKEVEDYYNKYKDQDPNIKEQEQRQISEIVVSTEQEAKDIYILLLQGGDFDALAKERSRAPSKKDGGDVGFIEKGKKFSQYDEAAFSNSLEVGKTSNIFKGPDGYYILKLESKRGGKVKPFAEISKDIEDGLWELKQAKRIEEIINKQQKTAKLDFYEEEIK